jgi:hypothetical protein
VDPLHLLHHLHLLHLQSDVGGQRSGPRGHQESNSLHQGNINTLQKKVMMQANGNPPMINQHQKTINKVDVISLTSLPEQSCSLRRSRASSDRGGPARAYLNLASPRPLFSFSFSFPFLSTALPYGDTRLTGVKLQHRTLARQLCSGLVIGLLGRRTREPGGLAQVSNLQMKAAFSLSLRLNAWTRRRNSRSKLLNC